MDYKIVVDSCYDFNDDLKENLNVGIVPLKIDVEDKSFIDDGHLDINPLIDAMKHSHEGVKTSSPSPADFIKEYEDGENVFAVTISSKLSSTYNNAILARDMILEEKDKFIHVFDSKSASVGETMVALKLDEMIKKGLDNTRIVEEVEDYIDNMKTYFILESLDNLVKAGRVNKLMGQVASVLSIKPIMGASDGEIVLKDKVRGDKRAFTRLVDLIGEGLEGAEDKILGISHCNNLQKAKELKEAISARYKFKDIIIVNTGGLSTAYANDGGIIVAY